MDKSPEAFRTISEVAEALETPAHVLRFWESRFPQIRPVKRAGGRRYYRPADVALIAGIKHLLHSEGLTIRGVQKILREQGVRHVASLAGQGDIGHEDDVDAQLIAAMAHIRAMDAEENGEGGTMMPPLQAAESAQVVALETALGRREKQTDQAAARAAAPAEKPQASLFDFGGDAPNLRGIAPIAFESLAGSLRTLPRPLPAAVAEKLLVISTRLESLRDVLQARLAGISL